MRVHLSALKHGIPVHDIEHALTYARALRDLDDTRVLVLGPRADGRMLELVIMRFDEGPAVIHAMRMRRIYDELLEG